MNIDECVDSKAREMAATAQALIYSHEKHCSERWAQNFAELRGIRGELRWFLVSTLGIMISAVGYFLIRLIPM